MRTSRWAGSRTPTTAENGVDPALLDAVPRDVPHPGRWITAAVLLGLGVLFLYSLATNQNLDWGNILQNVKDPFIIGGLAMTLQLTALSMAIGIVLGVFVAVARGSANWVLARMAQLYIWFFRGVPLLVQLIFWYNIGFLYPVIGFGSFSWAANSLITPLMAACLGLGLNEGAYMAEIVRAGILSVDKGQTDAAYALGMPPHRAFLQVVLPQAVRLIIPPTGNQLIAMFKATSLVSVISVADLLARAQTVSSRTYRVMDMLIAASIWYLVCTTLASAVQARIEKRLARGRSGSRDPDRRPAAAAGKLSLGEDLGPEAAVSKP